MNAELDRDSQVIDSEKATAERMAGQLESLGREIKQKELHLDQTSQSDVDEFNRKVDAYNSLCGAGSGAESLGKSTGRELQREVTKQWPIARKCACQPNSQELWKCGSRFRGAFSPS